MAKDRYFDRFQDLCISILAQSDNCMESQEQFRAAKTVPELVAAWQRFWAGVLHEVPEQVISAFANLYPIYHDDIAKAGVYYNEAPPPSSLSAMILIGDKTTSTERPAIPSQGDPASALPEESALGGSPAEYTALPITGRHRIYVLGNMPLACYDHCNVLVNSARAQVAIYDNCRANVEQGTLLAYDRCIVNGHGDITCHDATTIYASGGTLHDLGHLAITAYNDTVIHSFTNKRITLHDKARLIIT